MDIQEIEVATDDGTAPCWIFRQEDKRPAPGVLFFPDAGSVRPTMNAMATRVAQLGYVVLMPHIFYRAGAYAPFDMMTVFSTPPERERLMTLVRSLDNVKGMRDAGHYLRALLAQPNVLGDRVGCMGYCIGGRLAFTAAGAHPDRVAAAAAIHGGGISTDAPESPHRQAAAIRGRIYVAVADEDPSCTPAQQAELVKTLAGAKVDFTLEHFAGCKHGFAVDDFPIYDRAAAERHWARVATLFADTLQQR